MMLTKQDSPWPLPSPASTRPRRETGTAAGDVLTSADEPGRWAESLRDDVDKFLAGIRAAPA
jgi:hypothetical protein